ncbi:MAG: hypothetical protein KGI86_12450, partial [Betaproteobacteria bacterium]|nr:hypothetical protein [Betaproteobacteria bacterium]
VTFDRNRRSRSPKYALCVAQSVEDHHTDRVLDLLAQFLRYCLMRPQEEDHLEFGVGQCMGAQPD